MAKFSSEAADFDSYFSPLPRKDDRVNSPSHYTAGSQEAIVTIEEAIEAGEKMIAEAK